MADHHNTTASDSAYTDTMERLNNATNIMALIDDLFIARRDGDLTLSQDGANGLSDLIYECRNVTRNATDALGGLLRAKRDAVENLSKDTEQNLYERGFREGAATAVAELAGPEGEDEQESKFLYGVTLGAFGVCWETGKRGAELSALVHTVKATALDAFRSQTPTADGAAPSPFGPSLTEPVPDQDRADLHHDRQSA